MKDEEVDVVALETWAGCRYYAVEIIGETAKRIRVRLSHDRSPAYIRLPGNRVFYRDAVFLVPKTAMRRVNLSRIEDDSYPGCVYEYGRTGH